MKRLRTGEDLSVFIVIGLQKDGGSLKGGGFDLEITVIHNCSKEV